MSDNASGEVLAALEMLEEALEAQADLIDNQGANAFRAHDHQAAQAALERAEGLRGARKDLDALGDRLRELLADEKPTKAERLARGLKTPQKAYRVPILIVLVEMGGGGQTAEVLDKVYARMKDQLNEYDHQLLNSEPHDPRWRNSAQWCRNTMRIEGLIVEGSPHGVWEISEVGRTWLAMQG